MKIIRMIVIASYIILGATLGVIIIPSVARDTGILHTYPWLANKYIISLIGILIFFLIFGIFIPRITKYVRKLEIFIMRHSAIEILFAAIGLIMGLLISVMISFILNLIGSSLFLHVLPIIITVFLSYLGFQFGLKKRDEMLMFLPEKMARSAQLNTYSAAPKIIDTSAVIDGRILEVIECGFLDGEILIPQGVINELQIVADSTDSVKRDKGQRGLDILNRLHDNTYPTRIIHPQKSYNDIDALLIKLAHKYKADVITTDFNLNKICHVQGVKVLNVNDLSEAVKPTVRQGDQMNLLLTKIGKEPGQGVGYLEDGTMVVIDDAKTYVGEYVDIEIISILQTSSGRIIFAKLI
ncbi:PIN/TRAM domain-containing protein [Staphylococcus debuckii]|uniref:PIN/TRAM domain-containing protein n=1 Tax=Staphylococcus debuckii TaxID=2044912 RepID=UPI000F430BF0|nr:PIN/TRAM domain-containing protein [Staphylococcus debuckii]AYU53935.1 PIN/TRAM domain-containing protein [Staphylococcus debuckii]AYU56312.1 PIN/TRAM domain-containing protein [Staphylococcus debuckii]